MALREKLLEIRRARGAKTIARRRAKNRARARKREEKTARVRAAKRARSAAGRASGEWPHTRNLYAAVLSAILVVSFGGSIMMMVGNMARDAGIPRPDEEEAAQVLAPVADADAVPVADPARDAGERGCVVVMSDGSRAGVAAETPAETDGGKAVKYYEINLTNAQQDVVYRFCEEYDLPAELAFGVIAADMLTGRETEEGGSHTVMELNPETSGWYAGHLGLTDLTVFEQNVCCGIFMLQEYYHKYGDVKKIAMCYELGESAAAGRWEDGEYTTAYADLVASRIATLKERRR